MSHENLLEDVKRFLPGKEKIALNEYLFKTFHVEQRSSTLGEENEGQWVELQGATLSQ